jgi:hypothetical protein
VIAKFDALLLAPVAFDEPIEFQRIVFSRSADAVDDRIVVGHLIPLFGVIPEVPDIVDQLAGVVDQHVVDADDSGRG